MLVMWAVGLVVVLLCAACSGSAGLPLGGDLRAAPDGGEAAVAGPDGGVRGPEAGPPASDAGSASEAAGGDAGAPEAGSDAPPDEEAAAPEASSDATPPCNQLSCPSGCCGPAGQCILFGGQYPSLCGCGGYLCGNCGATDGRYACTPAMADGGALGGGCSFPDGGWVGGCGNTP